MGLEKNSLAVQRIMTTQEYARNVVSESPYPNSCMIVEMFRFAMNATRNTKKLTIKNKKVKMLIKESR